MREFTFKITAIILLSCLLFQSCVVYQNVPVSLDQAVNKGRAKIVTPYADKILCKKIIFEDGDYYAIKEGDGAKILISSTNASEIEIFLYDNKKSDVQSLIFIGAVATGVSVILAIILAKILIRAGEDFWDWAN